MKYNFIYDESFLNNSKFELSLEERMIVSIIVTGGHNAIFYGYKPERLVNAIANVVSNRKVVFASHVSTIQELFGGGPELKEGIVYDANNGVLVMENLELFRTSVLQLLAVPMDTHNFTISHAGVNKTYDAKFQLIATTSSKDVLDWNKIKPVTDRSAIVYECKSPEDRVPVPLSRLDSEVSTTWNNHCQKFSESIRNCDIPDTFVGELEFSTEGRYVCDYEMGNCKNPVEAKKLARSIADFYNHRTIFSGDIRLAMKLYNCCV